MLVLCMDHLELSSYPRRANMIKSRWEIPNVAVMYDVIAVASTWESVQSAR